MAKSKMEHLSLIYSEFTTENEVLILPVKIL